MKNALRKLFILVFSILLTLILTESNIVGTSFSNNHFDCENTHTNNSNQIEDSHSISIADDFFASDSILKLSEIHHLSLLFSSSNESFQVCFTHSVWQPPKFV